MQEKRSKELQVKLGTLISFTITYCLLRNVSITPSTTANTGFIQENLSMFTGMQLDKISPFALGITPYLLSTLVLSLMKAKFLPDIKNFLENPANESKVKKIEYGIFLFYCVMQIFLLYGSIGLWYKIILLMGAIILRGFADKITKLKLINGISYILAVSIMSETIASISTEPVIGIASLFAMLIMSAFYFKGGEWLKTEYKNEVGYEFATDVHVSASMAGVGPLFFASMIATLCQSVMAGIGFENDIIFNVLYVIGIYGFTIYTFFKMFNPKKYVDTLIINGYSLQSKEMSLNGYESKLKRTLIKVSLISATALCFFSFLPIIIYHFFEIIIPISMVSIILLISIIIDFIQSLKFFNIKTGYKQLAYKGLDVEDLKH